MIYVDTSVILAEILAEDLKPLSGFWDRPGIISSRLAQYESWVVIQQRGRDYHVRALEQLLMRFQFIELNPRVLARALEPFPIFVRTLDAMHLSSALFLQHQNVPVTLAAFDQRLVKAAAELGIPVLADLGG